MPMTRGRRGAARGSSSHRLLAAGSSSSSQLLSGGALALLLVLALPQPASAQQPLLDRFASRFGAGGGSSTGSATASSSATGAAGSSNGIGSGGLLGGGALLNDIERVVDRNGTAPRIGSGALLGGLTGAGSSSSGSGSSGSSSGIGAGLLGGAGTGGLLGSGGLIRGGSSSSSSGSGSSNTTAANRNATSTTGSSSGIGAGLLGGTGAGGLLGGGLLGERLGLGGSSNSSTTASGSSAASGAAGSCPAKLTNLTAATFRPIATACQPSAKAFCDECICALTDVYMPAFIAGGLFSNLTVGPDGAPTATTAFPVDRAAAIISACTLGQEFVVPMLAAGVRLQNLERLSSCGFNGTSTPFCLVAKMAEGAARAAGRPAPNVTASSGRVDDGGANSTDASGISDEEYYDEGDLTPIDSVNGTDAANATTTLPPGAFRVVSTAAPQGNNGPITATVSGKPATVGDVAAAVLALPAEQRRFLSNEAVAIVQGWAANSSFAGAPLDAAALADFSSNGTTVDLTSVLTSIALMQQRGVTAPAPAATPAATPTPDSTTPTPDAAATTPDSATPTPDAATPTDTPAPTDATPTPATAPAATPDAAATPAAAAEPAPDAAAATPAASAVVSAPADSSATAPAAADRATDPAAAPTDAAAAAPGDAATPAPVPVSAPAGGSAAAVRAAGVTQMVMAAVGAVLLRSMLQH